MSIEIKSLYLQNIKFIKRYTMRHTFILCALLAATPLCFAQNAEIYPLGNYQELTDTKPHDSEATWSKLTVATQLSWASIDTRYKKLCIPQVTKQTSKQLKAWRGERVNAQAVLWTKAALHEATITTSNLKNGSAIIPASAIKANFVRYTMTDELNKNGRGTCSERPDKTQWDSSLVADPIDIVKVRDIEARTSQPIWMNVSVPSNTKPGTYKGTITVSGKDFKPMTLKVEIAVLNRTLPDPKDWKFHLDLWQNPYAVARYYKVPLWSKEHFDAMLPIMKMLANAGQKVITTTIMYKPWNGQTQDPFYSMVFRMKKMDGSWSFDYTVFDRWVEFMMNEVGITQQINCYTMIPWALSFDYFDQASNSIAFVKAKPGEKAYSDYWTVFLKDFARHLRDKGWFGKTTIAMDERPMEAMREAIKVIKGADPDFKISLAGGYHPEIQADLYDLCIPYGNNYPADIKTEREKKGQFSTYYTCCAETFPNMYTFSAPAEATWTAIHAVAGNYDGYLRWAVNSWPEDPLRDSRFRSWGAGDCFSIYPGPRSSIRFERLTEGIQDCEKIRILREELKSKGKTAELNKLNQIVSKFTPEGLSKTQQSADVMVNELESMINSL